MKNDLNPIERTVLRHYTMNFLKAHWPTITAALGVLIPFEIPSINAYVSAHPHSTIGVLLSAVVTTYYMKSPTANKDSGAKTN